MCRRMRTKRNTTLKMRIFRYLLLMVLIVATLIGSVSSALFSRQLFQTARQSCHDLLASASVRVSGFFEAVDNMSYALIYNRAIQNVLSASSREYVNQSAVYANRLNLYYTLLLQAASNPDIELSVHPLTSPGDSFYSQPSNFVSAEYDFSKSKWFERFDENADSNKLYLLNSSILYQSQATSAKAHIVAYRINYVGSFQPLGYLCIYIYADSVNKLLMDLSENISAITLTDDATGEVIVSHDPGEIEGGLDENAFAEERIVMLAGKQHIAMSAPVSGVNWTIRCAYDLSDIMAEAGGRTILMLGLSILLVLMSVPFLLHYTGRLLVPIEEMVIGMECVKMGRYDFQLPETGRDELGRLVISMNDTIKQLNDAKVRVQALSVLQRESDLQALRQQIRPHFLYNTLNIIIGMASVGDDDSIIVVSKLLSDMLRQSLNGAARLPLGDELEQAWRYIRISQYRFRGLFEVECDVEDSLLREEVPNMTLQPLIENSIIHGFSEAGKHGVLRISIKSAPEGLMTIIVEDTGSGISRTDLAALRDALADTDRRPEKNANIGLHNIYARLRLGYGDEMRFTIDSEYGEWTRVCIVLPRKQNAEVDEHV